MRKSCVFTAFTLLLAAISINMAYGDSNRGLEKVTLRIEGMTSSCCAPIIQDALLKTDGVKKASVIFEDSEAAIEFEAGKVTVDQLIQVVKKGGYNALVKKTINKYEKTKDKNISSTKINYLPLTIGVLLSIVLVLACLKIKVITGHKTMLRIIKQAFITKLSLIIGIAFGIIYAFICLLLGNKIAFAANRWIVKTTVLDLLVILVMAFLIAVVMALFTYAIVRCGITKSKKSGVGLLGILFALLASFGACCGPIIISLIGVGASMILAKYSGLFVSVSIIVLVGGIILSMRTIEKEEECVCCTPDDYIKLKKEK
ncbi:MAG: cation transporter [Bacteroidetes bacterium]|nr:cation transporter [Bacteroidota bacterium]MBU1423958.1 cation transporter [Bacteroidota bacterium]MBU2461669.1 cation transporter [bacterium]